MTQQRDGDEQAGGVGVEDDGEVEMTVLNGYLASCTQSSEGVQVGTYRKKTLVQLAGPMPHPFSCKTESGVQEGKAGDYLASDGNGGFYPVPAAFVAENYVAVEHKGALHRILAAAWEVAAALRDQAGPHGRRRAITVTEIEKVIAWYDYTRSCEMRGDS